LISVTKTVAIIPARSGSKGVPGKNVRALGGQPLIAWSIKACLKCATIDRVIVSTDSREYAELAVELGAEVPFLRPSEISGDRSTDYDFILHALNWFASVQTEPDLLVHIRPTTPYRLPALIDEAVQIFLKQPKATALRSVHKMSETAFKSFEISTSGLLKQILTDSTAIDSANNARQDFPDTYEANGYVDILSSRFIRSSGLLHGDCVIPFITPPAIEVDTEEDFANLEFMIERFPDIAQQIFD